jgi:hypothetical protein
MKTDSVKASKRPKTSAIFDMGGLTTDRTMFWMTRTVATSECALNALVA